MQYRPIIIVGGEPNSVFLEIFFKSLKFRRFKSPIILIASKELVIAHMKKLNFKFKLRLLNHKKLNLDKIDNKKINLIHINYNINFFFKKISYLSKEYINDSFRIALKIMKSKISNKLINGPISKKHFLDKKYLGITEFLAHKTNSKKFAMLIYNKKLSVSPVTTHLPLKLVSKNINKKLIIEKIELIYQFYKNFFQKKPKIAITCLNPHCKTNSKYDENSKIIKPSIIFCNKKKINIDGPFSSDTIFLKQNRKKYDVIIGMYHDQVLNPMKTLFEYDAINITLGLPFIRISPDHGPNENMIGKNLSDPTSLIRAIEFLDR